MVKFLKRRYGQLNTQVLDMIPDLKNGKKIAVICSSIDRIKNLLELNGIKVNCEPIMKSKVLKTPFHIHVIDNEIKEQLGYLIWIE